MNPSYPQNRIKTTSEYFFTQSHGHHNQRSIHSMHRRPHELGLGKEQVLKARDIQLGIHDAHFLTHVLVQGAHEDHGHRGVEDVVGGDVERVENGLFLGERVRSLNEGNIGYLYL